jgi:hypothetical protein
VAEKKATATSTEAKAEGESGKAEYSEDSIEYVDKGDSWEVHDRRLGDDRVSTIPKTQRDVPVDEATHKEIEERLEAEQQVLDQKAEDAASAGEAPPVADDSADVEVTSTGKSS